MKTKNISHVERVKITLLLLLRCYCHCTNISPTKTSFSYRLLIQHCIALTSQDKHYKTVILSFLIIVKVSLSSLFIISEMTMQPWIGENATFKGTPSISFITAILQHTQTMNFHNANSVIYDCTSAHYR